MHGQLKVYFTKAIINEALIMQNVG